MNPQAQEALKKSSIEKENAMIQRIINLEEEVLNGNRVTKTLYETINRICIEFDSQMLKTERELSEIKCHLKQLTGIREGTPVGINRKNDNQTSETSNQEHQCGCEPTRDVPRVPSS